MNKRYNIRGLSLETIKKMNKLPTIVPAVTVTTKKIINAKKRFSKKDPITSPKIFIKKDRPKNSFLTSLLDDVVRLNLPRKGSFNAGLAKLPGKNEYICVFRPDEYSFTACILTSSFQIKENSYFKFNITNCADPRLVWIDENRLLMVYSSTSEGGMKYECIRGSIIMDLSKYDGFLNNPPFRISPRCDTRHKNWMPFIHDNKIYLIANVCPHIIYELKLNDNEFLSCEQVFETKWLNPWMFKEFLRGNTNAVLLEDGNYMSTFHTASWYEKRCYYDNGAYIFEGKPPFKVLKCANRTYLPAEDAVEPHYRKVHILECVFPVGMVRQGENLYISYGDNDSCVKIMKTTVKKMTDLMLDVY